MKWTKERGLYRFVIEERNGKFDLDVFYLTDRDAYWFHSLNSAKAFVRKEYEGIEPGRWVKVKE